MRWASVTPILGFLGLSVLELGLGTRQTDGQTDTGHHFVMPLLWSVTDVVVHEIVFFCHNVNVNVIIRVHCHKPLL